MVKSRTAAASHFERDTYVRSIRAIPRSIFYARLVLTGICTVMAMAAPAAQAASPFELQADSPRVRTPKDREACEAQQLPWCRPASEFKETSGWTLVRLAEAHAAITARFAYSYTPSGPWRSRRDQVASGLIWRGECDTLTFTVLDSLAHQGFPPTKMFRAIVSPQGNAASVMHMVGIVEVEGVYFVVGDTSRPEPYPASEATFKPRLLSNVAAGEFWLRAALNSRVSADAS